MPDNWLADAIIPISPHSWAFDLNKVHSVSGEVELQGPVIETIFNWVHQNYLPSLEDYVK